MIYESSFKGSRAIVLESEQLKVIVLPEIGGKIASIYNKSKSFELLFQNNNENYRKAALYDHFGEFDASGFDDAFPCVDEGMVKIGSSLVKYPDHGEIWSMGFQDEIINEKLILSGSSTILPYHYVKVLSLKEETLTVEYKITNHGQEDIPCLWAMHCLIRCEEDMQLIFPKGTAEVRNVLESEYLGEIDKVYPFPAAVLENGVKYRFDRVLPRSMNKYEKYYVNGEVMEGTCGAYFPEKDVTYLVHFDKEKLPYLGFYVTEGGFRKDYNCAMEPANGFYDSIETAQRESTLHNLKAGTSLYFDLKLELK